MIRIAVWGMTNNRGGIESMIMNIYRNLDRTKVQFDFLLSHNEGPIAFEDEILAMGGRIFRILYSERESFIKSRTCWMKYFKEHPEVTGIHIHANFPYAFPLVMAKRAGIELRILHSHNSAGAVEGVRGIKKIIIRIRNYFVNKQIKSAPNLYFSCSDIAADYMFSGEKYVWIKNGIDLTAFDYDEKVRDSLREKYNIATNDKVIGFVGRFRTQKNPLFLIDIYSEYVKLNEASKLVLIGVGGLEKEIKNRIKKYDIEEKVLFLGSRKDVNKWYQVFDLLLLPSIYEGLPVVLVEAQAAGLPSLASDNITKQIKVTDLLHYKSLDIPAKEWAEEIKEILNSYDRKSYMEDMEKAGFDIKQVSDEVMKYYCKNNYVMK